MTAVRGAAANAALGAPEWCGHHARLRRPAGEGLRRLLAVVALAACAAGALLAALQNTAGRGGRRHAVALEGPWTPESEVVMKPGLTFNEMNQLHGQVQQARWASRFGDNVPKQYAPPVSVWGAARAVAPREGGGVTLNLAEQGAALPSTQPPLIRQRDAERYARAGAELPRAPDGESGADRAAASADDGWHPRSSFSRAAPRARGREAVWDEGRSLWQGGAGTRGGEAPRRGGEDSGYPESGDEPGWAAGPPPEERPLISAAASAVRTPGDVARDMAWAAAGGSLLQGGGPRREGPGPLLPGGGGHMSAGEAAAKAAYDHLRGRGGARGDGLEGRSGEREEGGASQEAPGEVGEERGPQRAWEQTSGGRGVESDDQGGPDAGEGGGAEKLPAPPPGFPSFGNTAPPPPSGTIHWLHASSAPPAPRWVREDEAGETETDSVKPSCGWKCVPKSEIAPFNPLSAYQHMTSPSAALNPPAWVRHDFDGSPGGGVTGGPGGGNQMPGPRGVGGEGPDGKGESLESMWQTAHGGLPVASPGKAASKDLGTMDGQPGAAGTSAEEQLKDAVDHLGDDGGVRVSTSTDLSTSHADAREHHSDDQEGNTEGNARAESGGQGRQEGGAGIGTQRDGLQTAEQRRERYAARQDDAAARDFDLLEKQEAALQKPLRDQADDTQTDGGASASSSAVAHRLAHAATNSKEAALARMLARVAHEQAETALNNQKFREFARKIEPNVDVKYPRASSSENADGEAGSGVVGLLHSELQKEVSEQKQDAMLSEELKHLIARAKSPQFLRREAKHATAHLLAHQELEQADDTVSDILPPPTSQPHEAGTKHLLPTLIKQLQASNDADSDVP